MNTWIRRTIVTSGLALAVVLVGFAPAAASATIRVTDRQIAQFEGTWVGRDNPSPVGPLDFAMDFRREADGSLHSHTALSRETWIDLHFRKASGGWVLHESAALAGLGEQAHPMHPVRAAGDTVEWAYLPDPVYLTARTAVSADELYMQVLVRGRQHALFRLQRATAEVATVVREQLERARELPGHADMAQLEQAGDGEDPIDVRNARAKARALPRESAAQLELGNAVAAVIGTASPARRPLYAQEMLTAYRTAVALDERNVEAHYGLSQYYLHAPEIAGGSVEKGEAAAVTLTRLGSPLGEVVWAQVESKRGQRDRALARLRAVVERHPDLAPARRLLLTLSGDGKPPDAR